MSPVLAQVMTVPLPGQVLLVLGLVRVQVQVQVQVQAQARVRARVQGRAPTQTRAKHRVMQLVTTVQLVPLPAMATAVTLLRC